MFISEILNKFGLAEVTSQFAVTAIGDEYIVVEGTKTILLSHRDEIKLRVKNLVVRIEGEKLDFVEIGGGDVLVKGKIKGILFE